MKQRQTAVQEKLIPGWISFSFNMDAVGLSQLLLGIEFSLVGLPYGVVGRGMDERH